MPNVKITLTPIVAIANRVNGSYGVGEVINLSCVFTPAVPGLAGIAGGVVYKVKMGSGKISAAIPGAGTAVFTAANKAENVTIEALSGAVPQQTLASVGLKIVAPTSLKFVKASNIHHNNLQADCGFRGAIYLQPPGVSYQNLQVREGEFKGKGTGYYEYQEGLVHPATAVPVGIINGNRVNGLDTIYSGANGAPYSVGKFEWYIPWQYRLVGTTEWTTFEYATHTQEINQLGRVSIAKFNEGPYSANINDPTQAY